MTDIQAINESNTEKKYKNDICFKCRYIEDGYTCGQCSEYICNICRIPICDWCTWNYGQICNSCPVCNPHIKVCSNETMCKKWVDKIIAKGEYLWCIKHDTILPNQEPLAFNCATITKSGPIDPECYVKY